MISQEEETLLQLGTNVHFIKGWVDIGGQRLKVNVNCAGSITAVLLG